ncbi:YkgJ family cysteine cluster protein [Acidovorax sp. LjRoot117]|uniref:YkgJ family cysteine cluster protein n=1 Tax=Acidovorax sp. LjRoot117 TaxID=3342255 RepID=UPI003F50384A
MSVAKNSTSSSLIDAGDFDTWLGEIQASFQNGMGTSVPCGDCRGCCTSSYFIYIRPTDTKALSTIPRQLLTHAPGLPKGHSQMGYKPNGHCPMLKNKNCSIYSKRPLACKDYDCRVFAAAGFLEEGASTSDVNMRISAWEFQYSSSASRQRHQAIKEAARFIIENKSAFPHERAPAKASEIAIIAIKVHHVFLNGPSDRSAIETARNVIQATREFDTMPRRDSR